jgi:hypothetical protein
MLIRILEVLAILAVVLLFFTQILIPWFRGTVFFPLFRREAVKRERELKEQLRNIHQREVEKELEEEVKSHEKSLKRKSK